VSKLFQLSFVAFITCALLRSPQPDVTLENDTEFLPSQLSDDENDESDDTDAWLSEELANAEADKKFAVEIPKLNCCMCILQFEEEYDLISHAKSEHMTERFKISIFKKIMDCVRCELCLKLFKSFDKLVEHQNQYKLAKQCPICGIFIPPSR
jgi:hypothetical protein